ncbi:MAG: hypothetical protein QNJ51_11935 [Calothrix sp. MO_167.B12]|nr:hypothetical protein [Calothrix sp. MO_167.B12]
MKDAFALATCMEVVYIIVCKFIILIEQNKTKGIMIKDGLNHHQDSQLSPLDKGINHKLLSTNLFEHYFL